LDLPARKLPRAVAALLAEGWHVEADGKLYRHAGAVHIDVTSDIDWFELRGTVEFGEISAPLPRLLAALKRGERTVRLGDGTFGVLPEEWLQQYGALADLGQREDDHLRFTRPQVGVLDALLAALPDATTDATFARARDELARFEGVEPLDPPAGFAGTLRGYQREGLGWLAFLQRFGFGGCLADDMGLGKTVQVLALLEARREQAAGLSLVVVPKSLVFNWMQEAARFTPALRVLDHTGTDRTRDGDTFGGYDVVLTTYGTLRRDAVHLKDREFDYVVLDEAQAIKNADTESAKAARLLRGRHRLALSGTPIENHLGELWSLFEFLNPGMLGSASAFGLSGAGGRTVDEPARALLARALRPFVLRRTKAQVAQDLPRKLEQTLYCELDGAQRALYDELREHYRRALLGRIAREGLGRSKIQILEALLRLRQAACHPALIDRGRAAEGSAKFDMLLPRLAEVADEGHKALVFSQFTSLLALVRARLDRDGIPYEYLDGRTRDRAARVTRFQADPGCRLFLVSLKAGGLGLNLTAAEYVFLLDPWWNPAVEAQAIDRTHRIGQTRPVFAYRLIARGTVEEKVLELQQTKRDLADAIINADNSLLRTLTRDDLELLLS
ncbi:MAG TPA: SNF2-related protein, partial [Candidatus Limnocylindria bacterium]|nr:SNF2-related protein [Candidatus Limnocylindria bacterium]